MTTIRSNMWRRAHSGPLLAALLLGPLCGCPQLTGTGDKLSDNGDTCKCTTDLLVTIEVRFITVSDNFLQDVGVDLNQQLDIESNTPDSVAFPALPFTQTDAFAYPGLAPGAFDADAVLSLDPTDTTPGGLSFASTFLDDTQLEVILRAVERSQAESLLSAPKITLIGGQDAFIFLFDEQTLIGDLESDFSDTLLAIDPLIWGINTGPSLGLKFRGLQDDQDVVLELRPSVGGTFNTPDVAGDRPIVRTSSARTTVLVPDGQTVVLGGLIDASNTQTEGVLPFFGDIPILSSAFRNRTHTTDQTNLIILVTPQLVANAEYAVPFTRESNA